MYERIPWRLLPDSAPTRADLFGPNLRHGGRGPRPRLARDSATPHIESTLTLESANPVAPGYSPDFS